MATLKLLEEQDLKVFAEHSRRLSLESGRDGDFIFAPQEGPEDTDDETIEEKREQISKKITEVGWRRIWVIVDGGEVKGDIQLVQSPALTSSLHRASLGMGIERSHRSQGWGRKLMKAAIDWANDQPSLEWLQLYVFEHNLPARQLYSQFGFEERGMVEDVFRVFGQKVNDITMVKRLR